MRIFPNKKDLKNEARSVWLLALAIIVLVMIVGFYLLFSGLDLRSQ